MALLSLGARLNTFKSRDAGKHNLSDIAGYKGANAQALAQHGRLIAEVMVALLPENTSALKRELGQAQHALTTGRCATLGEAIRASSPGLRAKLIATLPYASRELLNLAQETHPATFQRDLINLLPRIKKADPYLAQKALASLKRLSLPKNFKVALTEQADLFTGKGSTAALLQHYTTIVSHEISAHPESIATLALGGAAFQGARYLTALKLKNAGSIARFTLPSLAGWAVETPAITASSAVLATLSGEPLGPLALAPTYINMGVFHLGGATTRLGLGAFLRSGSRALSTSQQIATASASKISALSALHSGHQLTHAMGYQVGPDTSFAGSLAEFVKLEISGGVLHTSARYNRAHRYLNTQGTLAIQGAFRGIHTSLRRGMAQAQTFLNRYALAVAQRGSPLLANPAAETAKLFHGVLKSEDTGAHVAAEVPGTPKQLPLWPPTKPPMGAPLGARRSTTPGHATPGRGQASSTIKIEGIKNIQFALKLERAWLDNHWLQLSRITEGNIDEISWDMKVQPSGAITEFLIAPSQVARFPQDRKLRMTFRFRYNPQKDQYVVIPSLSRGNNGHRFLNELRSSPVVQQGHLIVNPNNNLMIHNARINIADIQDMDWYTFREFQRQATRRAREAGEIEPGKLVDEFFVVGTKMKYKSRGKGNTTGEMDEGFTKLRGEPQLQKEDYSLMQIRVIERDGIFYLIQEERIGKGRREFIQGLQRATIANKGQLIPVWDINEIPNPTAATHRADRDSA